MIKRLILTLSVFSSSMCFGELALAPIFTDHMVLQRETSVPIWGTATAGDALTLSFGDQSLTTKSGADGAWKASLKSLKASAQPAVLRVESGRETVTISDVLVGDVWLCSGQSNMGFKLANCIDGKSDAAAATDALLRVNNYRVDWAPCTGGVAGETSGVAYYFARKLRETNPEVPVGLIVRALSGSPIEAWTPTVALTEVGFSKEMMKRFNADSEEGKRWMAYAEAEEERKRAKRKGEARIKGAGKRPTFDGDADTKVLAEIYYADNPGLLWRERIEPVVGYGIAGVVWYQGERNSKAGERAASAYGDLLVALITRWRAAWAQGDFRFLAVQLPTFEKGGPNWSIVQQGQAAAVQKVANAASVDLSDLPDDGLHPRDKRPVGERLAGKAIP